MLRVMPSEVAAMNAEMVALTRAGRWQCALVLFRAMPGLRVAPTVSSRNAVLSAYGSAAKWAEVLHVLRRWLALGVVVDAVSYSAAIHTCGMSSRPSLALRFFEEVSSCSDLRPTATTLGAAVAACARGGLWQHSLALLDRACGAALPLSIVAFNAAVTACSRSRQWWVSLSLLRTSGRYVLSPDVFTFNAALSSGESGIVDDVLMLLRVRRVMPDVITYNSSLSALATTGAWETAARFVSDMRLAQIPPDIITFNSLIAAGRQALQWAHCLHQFLDLGTVASQPSMVTFGDMLVSFSGNSRWQLALSLLQGMSSCSALPDVLMLATATNAFILAGAWHCLHGAWLKLCRRMIGYLLNRPPLATRSRRSGSLTPMVSAHHDGLVLPGPTWRLLCRRQSSPLSQFL
jgi:hypothetical protein